MVGKTHSISQMGILWNLISFRGLGDNQLYFSIILGQGGRTHPYFHGNFILVHETSEGALQMAGNNSSRSQMGI